MGFKKDFLWGGSVSSMQTEGAWNEGGKGLSIYDVRPVKEGRSDWKAAIDTYHRYKEDSKLFAGMGFNAYRFSISWSRIFPDGEGAVNLEGLGFYDDFIDDLIEKGMEPVVCFYHFDMPLNLQRKYNGWLGRETVDAFKVYVETIIKHFGGRVKYYIPFNEQNAACLMAAETIGVKTDADNAANVTSTCTHHMFMAGAHVRHAINEFAPHAKAGGMVNFMAMYPATCRPEDIIAANAASRSYNYQTLDVIATGEYPSDLWRNWEKANVIPPIQEGDLDYLKEAKFDFIAHSYYTSAVVSAKENGEAPSGAEVLMSMLGGQKQKNPYLKESQWDWAIDPAGLRNSVSEMYHRYRLPVFTIECGIGVDEQADEKGYVDDQYRIDYFKSHLEQLKLAVDQDGVDLMGFLTWGPIDILSSQGEMKKRYGFIYVNRTDTELKDLKRSKKKSYDWFRRVIVSNGEEL